MKCNQVVMIFGNCWLGTEDLNCNYGVCELEKVVEQFNLNDRQYVRVLTENL
jgi:hypothetical protein